jgi:uncharacterized protein YdhG (YjbR/CyaY superfamily)
MGSSPDTTHLEGDPPMATTQTTKRTSTKADRFTDEEKAAMKERAAELKKGTSEDAEKDLLVKIAALPEADRKLAERIHAIVRATAPELVCRTYYGMPAYAKDGKVLCFFQPASKFKARYATFGFNEDARLDDGTMWPTSWAITTLSPADEARIASLVKQAVG